MATNSASKLLNLGGSAALRSLIRSNLIRPTATAADSTNPILSTATAHTEFIQLERESVSGSHGNSLNAKHLNLIARDISPAIWRSPFVMNAAQIEAARKPPACENDVVNDFVDDDDGDEEEEDFDDEDTLFYGSSGVEDEDDDEFDDGDIPSNERF